MSISDEGQLEPSAAGGGGGSGVIAALVRPFALLFAPDRAMPQQARIGRAGWFFLAAWLCSIALGASLALRVDGRSSTLQKLEQSGQLQSMSDRQIADDTRSAERVAQVASIAKGVVATPVQLALGCLSLLLLSWFFRGRLKGSAVVPIAATTLLPTAIANLVDVVAALRLPQIPPEGVALGPRSLSAILMLAGRPLMGPWLKLGDALDLFSLWTAVMLGFGLVAAAQVPRRTALTGTLVAWICYRLLTHVATGG